MTEESLDKPDTGRTDEIGKRVLEKITWEWQRVDDIITALIYAVPPGKALRQYQKNAQSAGNKGIKVLTEDEQQQSGARTILNARLASHQNSGRIVIERRDNERWVKFNERRANAQAEPSAPRGFPVKDAFARSEILQLKDNDVVIARGVDVLAARIEALTAAVEGLRSQFTDLRDELSFRSGTSDVNDLREMVEVLEAEVNSTKVDTAAVVETSMNMAARVTDVESSLVRLVSRLSGAVSAKEVFQLEREH